MIRKIAVIFWLACAILGAYVSMPGLVDAVQTHNNILGHLAWFIPAAVCVRLALMEGEGK